MEADLTQPLDLKLTDEEKQTLWDNVVGRTDQTTLLSTTYGMYTDLVEKAATAKAAYAILEWLGEWGMHSFCGKHHFPPIEYANPKLFDILKALGIENPAGDGEFHEIQAQGVQKPEGD